LYEDAKEGVQGEENSLWASGAPLRVKKGRKKLAKKKNG